MYDISNDIYIYYIYIYNCDAPRQNQALLAKFCSAQEPKMHGARSNCRKSVNDGIEQRNYPAFHKSIYIS